MIPQPGTLLDIANIKIPLIGIYDVADPAPFEPLSEKGFCIFENFEDWSQGKSTIISKETAATLGCPGGGYWLCGVESMPRVDTANYLAGKEGLKDSPDLMCKWIENCPPYQIENSYIAISKLKDDLYDFLKTITFYVNPDQLSLLLTGAEYMTASKESNIVAAPYGSGCGQLLTQFQDLDSPKAIIGATDFAMRQCLPADILAFTVTKPMFEQLCQLDENSFLHKSFWKTLQETRAAMAEA